MRRVALLCCGVGLVSSIASASELDVEYSGLFQTDLRFRFNKPEVGTWYNPVEPLPISPEIKIY